MIQEGKLYTIVNDEDSNEIKVGLSNVYIYFIEDKKRKYTFRTDSGGNFRFDLPRGKYQVSMSLGPTQKIFPMAGGALFEVGVATTKDSFEKWLLDPSFLSPENNPLIVLMENLVEEASKQANLAKEQANIATDSNKKHSIIGKDSEKVTASVVFPSRRMEDFVGHTFAYSGRDRNIPAMYKCFSENHPYLPSLFKPRRGTEGFPSSNWFMGKSQIWGNIHGDISIYARIPSEFATKNDINKPVVIRAALSIRQNNSPPFVADNEVLLDISTADSTYDLKNINSLRNPDYKNDTLPVLNENLIKKYVEGETSLHTSIIEDGENLRTNYIKIEDLKDTGGLLWVDFEGESTHLEVNYKFPKNNLYYTDWGLDGYRKYNPNSHRLIKIPQGVSEVRVTLGKITDSIKRDTVKIRKVTRKGCEIFDRYFGTFVELKFKVSRDIKFYPGTEIAFLLNIHATSGDERYPLDLGNQRAFLVEQGGLTIDFYGNPYKEENKLYRG